jgi:hypothetical protein
MAAHQEAARLLDSIVERTGPVEAAVQTYSDAEDAYWRYEMNLQARRIVVRELLSSPTDAAELQRQEEAFAKEESEAKNELQSVHQKGDLEVEQFAKWLITTKLKLQHLFPSFSAAINANFTNAESRLANARVALADRDLGFRVLFSLRDRRIRERIRALHARNATSQEIDQFTTEAAILETDKRSAHVLQFTSLRHLADMLRAEQPLPEGLVTPVTSP